MASKTPPKFKTTSNAATAAMDAKDRSTITVEAQFPPYFEPLLTKKARWKCVRGGRGGAKSTSIAKALLLIGQQKPVRILCVREVQQSIRESVHNLLASEVANLGLQSFYTVERTSIFGPWVPVTTDKGVTVNKRTEFIFAGLKGNVSQIKSYNDISYCWLEEASACTAYHLRILSPTIRNPGSEIWVSYNPERENDAIHLMMNDPPEDSIVINCQYYDNPWFGEPLLTEMEEMKRKDYNLYLHVWEGHCLKYYEGAVYLNEMKLAEQELRITDVPYRPDAPPPQVAMDIGFYDMTACTVFQQVDDFINILAYHQNRQKPLEYYLAWLESLPYPIGKIWLPHDARQRTATSGPNTYESLVRAKGHRVQVVGHHLINEGINALRTIFPRMRIDADGCYDLVECLKRYRYELEDDNKGGFKQVPVHDAFSHGADSARYMAMALRKQRNDKHPAGKYANLMPFRGQTDGWMSL